MAEIAGQVQRCPAIVRIGGDTRGVALDHRCQQLGVARGDCIGCGCRAARGGQHAHDLRRAGIRFACISGEIPPTATWRTSSGCLAIRSQNQRIILSLDRIGRAFQPSLLMC